MDRMEEYKALRDAPEELPPPWRAPWPAPGPRARRRGCGGGSAPRRERGGGVCRLRAPGEPVHPPSPWPAARVPVLKELAAAVAFSPASRPLWKTTMCSISVRAPRTTHHRPSGVPDGRPGRAEHLFRPGGPEATFFMPRNVHPDGERLEGCSVLMDSELAPGEDCRPSPWPLTGRRSPSFRSPYA